MKLGALFAAAAAFAAITGGAQAAQITLAPSNVIGSSGYYVQCCNFNPGSILDNQTGPITENFGSGYWLNPDNGPANAFITVDLGAVYQLGSVELYNTHNGPFQDRGTGAFSIYGSNSVINLGGGNYGLSNANLLLSATLIAGDNSQIILPAQTFNLNGAYRYISFNPTSVAVGGNPCCGANNYGLNELRVFTGSGTPEPAAWALMITGFGAAGAMLRRRRTATAA